VRLSTKLSGIVAVGGVAALGAGLVSSGGIGAAFTDSATAKASINAGTFSCQLESGSSNVNIDDSNQDPNHVDKATITLSTITSSDPASKTGKVIVKNTGTIPLYVNWSSVGNGNIYANGISPAIPGQDLRINAGDTRTYNLGFAWQELGNNALGTHGDITYTANCIEASHVEKTAMFVNGIEGGTANWNDASGISFDIPAVGSSGVWPAANAFFEGNWNNLPADEPSFAATSSKEGMPKWVIDLDNGYTLGGFAGRTGTYSWQVSHPGESSYYSTWSDILGQWGPSGTDPARVSDVQLVAFGAAAFTATVTCAVYDGTAYVGTSPEMCAGWHEN
jgi:hypothetical protein